MLFDSPAYFIFLIPVWVLLYWRLNRGEQNVFLLLASYFFYGWWDWRFLALMIGSTTIDFPDCAENHPQPLRHEPQEVVHFLVGGEFFHSRNIQIL